MATEFVQKGMEAKMKLIYKLNLSFGFLLLSVLIITAGCIYPLLYDTLVEGQRREMQVTGRIYLDDLKAMPDLMRGKNLSLEEMSFTTDWIEFFNWSKNIKHGFMQGTDERYIVETLSDLNVNKPNITTVVLATPLSKIKSMQSSLFSRMMLALSIGGVLAFILSLFITKRLVTPLMRLREELKKVEERRFADVQLVKSDGEIGEVAQNVYQLARELDKYHDAQKQFFQNASHELKTPLMSIQGFAEGIREGIFTGEEADSGLEIISTECERLKRIINEMILLTKLESEDSFFENFDVSIKTLIRQTVERINPLLLDKGLQIKILYSNNEQLQPHIKADPEKVLQALLNIVSNASRYAKETISITILENDNRVAIEICDDGEGIPEAILPRLFQRFVKGQDGQTGLGLAISRAIVERSQGQISAHNNKSGGAAFVMSFPISAGGHFEKSAHA